MNGDLAKKTVSIDAAIQLLQQGAVGVMPTDTVYGLVGRAKDPQAVQRLYALKHRERKPGTLIAASVDQVRDLGVPPAYLENVVSYWPGALSAVLPIGEDFLYLHQGIGDIAMRVVADKAIQHILEQTGPLITSSANHPGAPGSVDVTEAWNYFGNEVDFYVDGGDRSGQPPSTIIKLTSEGEVELIRQGAVTL